MINKSFFKNLTFALGSVLALCLCGCSNSGGPQEKDVTIPTTEDKYGTYYEIFPYAFADSNNDGVGDLQGIIDKVDYIDSLHYDGVWLTPIHQSGTYHKYDVDDYKSIDAKFGTLSTYDTLVSKLHQKGMKILLDLVFNHSSSQNVWFTTCLYDHLRNKTSDQYYNYYNVAMATSNMPSGWCSAAWLGYPTLMYEGQFWEGMPDLNLQNVLDNPNGYLANDLKDVMKFWLVDHNVDGFRLDAVTSYFTGNSTKNGLFLKWLHDYCVSIKPNVYIVGEGSWTTPSENLSYQTVSGVDSFFNFEDNGSAGYPAHLVSSGDATYLSYTISKNLNAVSSTGIPACFIANHDTGRLYAAAVGSQSINNVKFLNGVLQMLNGATFSYYGDEVGMNALRCSTCTSFKDEDKRQPMPWADSYRCKPVTGSTAGSDNEKYVYGTVEDQVKDSNSLVNYVAKANKLRRACPAIARGKTVELGANSDDSFAIVSKTYGDEVTYIAINASKKKSVTYELSSAGISDSLSLVGYLLTDGNLSYSSNKLEMPAQSIVILEKDVSK
jgi:glycosidase